MSRTITIDPVTRIEGHARVELQLADDNTIEGAVFKVLDFRGWETFLCGMQVEMMPTITARICGTCPHSHHLAAARAVDKVHGVTIPRAAELLRYALNMGAFLHSHATHFFALAGPDLLLGLDSDPAKRNIMGLVEAAPEVATKALRLRTIGHKVVELIGGRGTHPVSLVAGGLSSPLDDRKKERLKSLAAEGLELGKTLFDVGSKALADNPELSGKLPLETHYLATVNDGQLDFYQGDLRLTAPDGTSSEFSEDDWTEHLHEETAPTSYAKSVFCRVDGKDPVPYRVGPLARINCVDRIDTPLAQEALEAFRESAGHPSHQTVLYNQARLIEMLHATEKLAALVEEEELYADTVRVQPSTPRSATAHVEAPRGVLIHEYDVDSEGLVERANLLVATQQNMHAINDTIRLSAGRYMDQPDELLLNAIEFGIRCYDPCLSCATHRIGEMRLDVTVRSGDRVVRRVRR